MRLHFRQKDWEKWKTRWMGYRITNGNGGAGIGVRLSGKPPRDWLIVKKNNGSAGG
jgi:hypothetical protein